jgi:hypothetical protein
MKCFCEFAGTQASGRGSWWVIVQEGLGCVGVRVSDWASGGLSLEIVDERLMFFKLAGGLELAG